MKITSSIQISAPGSKVFNLFTDLNQIERIIPGINNIEILEGPPKMALGTKWKETRIMFGKEATETMAVSEIQTDTHYIVDAASHGMKYRSKYSFEEIDGGTTVNMTFIGTPVTLMAKLFTPIGYLFKGATKKALVADMEELKLAIESS